MAMNTVWCLFWLTFSVGLLIASIVNNWGAWDVAWAAADLGLWIGLTAFVLTRGDR